MIAICCAKQIIDCSGRRMKPGSLRSTTSCMKQRSMNSSLRSGDISGNGGRRRSSGYTVRNERASRDFHFPLAVNEYR